MRQHLAVTIEKWSLRLAPPIATLFIPTAIVAVFFWVPTDAGLGLSQRIFYFHVPCALAAFASYAAAGLSAIAYLRSSSSEWDHASNAAVGTGMLFGSLVLITGSIWARTAWGTWWTWDARLTTFLILWLVFASYAMLRALARGSDMAPRYAAVLAIVGTMNIPLVMVATKLWRTIHPQVIGNPKGGIEDPRMLATLGLGMVAILSLCVWFWALRSQTLRVEEKLAVLEASRT
jgi:heme exporter protein C